MSIVVENETGQQERIYTTTEHPFFTERFGFVPAGLLDKGQRLLRADNQYSTVVEVDLTPYELVAYNFEVADYHTCFVGEQRLWVHNACAVGAPGKRKYLDAIDDAEGPHTVWKSNNKGEITNHQTFEPNTNPNNPNKWVKGNRTDVTGKSEFNKETKEWVATPHTHDSKAPGGIRPAERGEIP